DLHLSEAVKQRIVERTAKGFYTAFGPFQIKKVEDMDGYKYYFDDQKNQWLLIRASGTEPVLRTYAESTTREGASDILSAAEKTLLAE
ncbi:MAG: phosphoglucomutase/phosphomannomutase family protein, partial [Bacteroidota bacterium]